MAAMAAMANDHTFSRDLCFIHGVENEFSTVRTVTYTLLGKKFDPSLFIKSIYPSTSFQHVFLKTDS